MALLRLALYRILWLRTEATIQASAEENSVFIETVRAMQSLKLFNRESEREGQWLNRYAEVANANVRLGRTKIAFSTLNELIFGLETVLVVYLAARLALGNHLTVGMIFAFMSLQAALHRQGGAACREGARASASSAFIWSACRTSR